MGEIHGELSEAASLRPLLAFFEMAQSDITCATVTRHKAPYHPVFHDAAHRLLIAFLGPTRGVELGPIHLRKHGSVDSWITIVDCLRRVCHGPK